MEVAELPAGDRKTCAGVAGARCAALLRRRRLRPAARNAGRRPDLEFGRQPRFRRGRTASEFDRQAQQRRSDDRRRTGHDRDLDRWRSEEHTTELQSLMRIAYDVLSLKKKIKLHIDKYTYTIQQVY